MSKNFKNPWAQGGAFFINWIDNFKNNVSNDNEAQLEFGGEVTNESDVSWAVSGISNSNVEHFAWLPRNKNSDDYLPIHDQLNGDVDAIWPLGQKIRLGSQSGKLVTSGAIKIVDYHNANIYGDSKNGYYITDYYHHYPSGSLPDGWVEPNRKDIK